MVVSVGIEMGVENDAKGFHLVLFTEQDFRQRGLEAQSTTDGDGQ